MLGSDPIIRVYGYIVVYGAIPNFQRCLVGSESADQEDKIGYRALFGIVPNKHQAAIYWVYITGSILEEQDVRIFSKWSNLRHRKNSTIKLL